MAIFLPALSSKNLKLTPGERRFGTCLMRKLEDDYHVWVNVPVGPKQFRPDYVVLHPGRGILVLEVEDGLNEEHLSRVHPAKQLSRSQVRL